MLLNPSVEQLNGAVDNRAVDIIAYRILQFKTAVGRHIAQTSAPALYRCGESFLLKLAARRAYNVSHCDAL